MLMWGMLSLNQVGGLNSKSQMVEINDQQDSNPFPLLQWIVISLSLAAILRKWGKTIN